MRPATLIVTAVFLASLVLAAQADACSSAQVRPDIWIFECDCVCEEGEPLTPDIIVVSGTILLNNRQATPELASLVVELETKVDRRYTLLARRVLNEAGDDEVETCDGFYTDSPLPGRLDFVDANGTPIPFASIKDLPEGRVTLSYIATISGNFPDLDLGGTARVRTLTTLINTDASRTCSIDATNDGTIDSMVKTHSDRSNVRIPAMPIHLPCPD